MEAAEQITLDVNELAKSEKFMSLGAYDDERRRQSAGLFHRQHRLPPVSPARARSAHGQETCPTPRRKPDRIVWAADNQTLFYTVEDSAKRQYRLYRHKSERTPRTTTWSTKKKTSASTSARAGRAAANTSFLTSGSHTTSEVRYLDAAKPAGEWKLIAPREQDIEYYADHIGDSVLHSYQ